MWNIFKKKDKVKSEKQTQRDIVAKSVLQMDDAYAFNPHDTAHKERQFPKKQETLPTWVEQYPGFIAEAWIVDVKQDTNTIVNLVTYVPLPTTMERPFAKIVFTENDVPFKQMKNLCAYVAKYNMAEVELHGSSVDISYSMGIDGKIRDEIGEFLPNAHLVHCAVYDLYVLYKSWRRFPNIDSMTTVYKLLSAWDDVVKMLNEERFGKIKKKIEDMREGIKSYQNQISQLESHKNEMYERAAEALNLLEEHGFDMKKIEESRKKDLASRSDQYALAL